MLPLTRVCNACATYSCLISEHAGRCEQSMRQQCVVCDGVIERERLSTPDPAPHSKDQSYEEFLGCDRRLANCSSNFVRSRLLPWTTTIHTYGSGKMRRKGCSNSGKGATEAASSRHGADVKPSIGGLQRVEKQGFILKRRQRVRMAPREAKREGEAAQRIEDNGRRRLGQMRP